MNMDDRAICHNCIGEPYLKNDIQQNGEVRTCAFCNTPKIKTNPLYALSDNVHYILEDHFYLTSSYPEGIEILAAKKGIWEQSGEPVTEVIQNLLDTTDSITEAIFDYLSEKHNAYGKDALCEPQPYDGEAYYAERSVDTYEFKENWALFKKEIYRRSRFFNTNAENILKEIFWGIGNLNTRNNNPVIRNLTPESHIYRARVADSPSMLDSILKELPTSLGAPPHKYAKSGRMNAEGIGILYGATDIETCINEIRAPVGSSVIVGIFHPLRDLRLLDLNLLKDVYQEGSIFDSDHIKAVSRQEFLKLLVDELSAPVMPGTESREYLPTQLVAEFLASRLELKLDGVFYKSSQIMKDQDDDTEESMNIVLFSHACTLKPYDIPLGTDIDITTGFGPPDDYDDSIAIFEEHPEPTSVTELKENSDFGFLFDLNSGIESLNIEDTDFNFEPSIELDMDKIEVHEIRGINFSKSQRNVSRHKYIKNEKSDF